LALALVLGAALRFADLGAYEMSADEGASWAAAVQPSFAEVLKAQRHLNPAELGLHDVALHYWMSAFGASVAAMRALSALAGTVAILLTFVATRELLALDDVSTSGDDHRDTTAALAALILAVSLLSIKYARELRMYPLMLALVIAQAICFLRAARKGSALAYAGVALFTALAIAAHPMAILVFAGEGVWLIYALSQLRMRFSMPSARRLLYLVLALAAGVILAGLAAAPMLAPGPRSPHGSVLNWVQRPALSAPFALFNKGAGSVAFPVLAALALWGAICGWRRMRLATLFLLLWMWLPPLALMVLSYAIRPVFVERYLITSFVPFFILAAIGIAELPSNSLRAAATTVVVILSLGHVYGWSRKPHDTQWREGLRIALAAHDGKPISVAPGYAVNVARYYLPESQPAIELVQADPVGAAGDVLLLSDQSKGEVAARLAAEYPNLLTRVRGLQIRGR
jgi:mannosyltransferase